jgi:hypothetical protein
MKAAGVLLRDTNISELTKRAFVELDGASDEWINPLRVEKVAGRHAPVGPLHPGVS